MKGGTCNCCSRLTFFWGSKGRERIVRRTNDWGREGGEGFVVLFYDSYGTLQLLCCIGA